MKTTKKVILYLIKTLKDKIEGRKKLVKLMFLIEHFDPVSKALSKEKTLGNRFLIYHHGVFSFEVFQCYNELVKEGKIIDGFPIKLKHDIKVNLNERLKNKVDKIIELFGNESGYNLEKKTLELLGINSWEKEKYFGMDVENIIGKKFRFNFTLF